MPSMHLDRQTMFALFGDGPHQLQLPTPDAEVLPGICWGAFDNLWTPAFWAGRAWMSGGDSSFRSHRLGRNLQEEVAACLLGGHGIPAEIGLAAFYRLRDSGILGTTPSAAEVEALLSVPLQVGRRALRYRFARQRSRYLAESLRALAHAPPLPDCDVAFRDALRELPGIGYKTASWITRNIRDSDEVAILDVHICRACSAVGVFPLAADPQSRYLELEQRFLGFAHALSVRPSLLDSVMWRTMRMLPQPSTPGKSTSRKQKEQIACPVAPQTVALQADLRRLTAQSSR